ncbi:MAG: 30S ribosomal protein S7 [Anaerolineales bacterium]|nr:30S ribosomal protein S7 [Anaerolineales bacterium]
MPRRYTPARRPLVPDIRFKSTLVSEFINRMMMDGKKSVAQRVMYDAMAAAAERAKKEPMEVLEAALRNVGPVVEVKPRRVGGATYQVPVEVSPDRRASLAMRWIIAAARSRSGKSMIDKLSGELLDASNNTGTAIKKREETHKMAEANRAFAHYRW